MLKNSMLKFAVVVIAVAALSLAEPAIAQTRRASYGPVIKAYLSGLDEELTELEFQLRHQEITRAIYDRTKQRLDVVRRYVQRLAAKSAEDRLPELQVLADDELSILKPNAELNPDELKLGDVISRRWRLASIERLQDRFFVLEKLLPTEISRVTPERKLGPEISLNDVIETFIIHEEISEPPTQNIQIPPTAVPTAEPTTPTAVEKVVVPKVEKRNPQLLHIYLPEYTAKAREKKIEGDLVVSVMLLRDGKIKKVKVEKGLGQGLDDRAIEAVKRLAFLPAELNGETVDATVQIVFNFKLEKVTLYIGEAELAKGAGR